jgi:ABC-2 type transport system permease protein
VASLAARQVLYDRGEALVRASFYVILLLVFSRLWGAMESGGAPGGVGPREFVWYLALTEWIILGTPMLYLAFEEDVRRGDIAYKIARPVSYVGMRFAEGMGETLARMLLLAVVGVAFAWWFSGGFPADPRGLLLAVPVGLLSAALMLLFHVFIGLLSFWLQEPTPVFWIVQKLMFVFGGLLFPLEIYPDWLRGAARWTPFAPMFHGCGRMAFGFDPLLALETAGKIVGWGLALGGLTAWVYRRGLRVLDVNGG